jgi:hypothetical protein
VVESSICKYISINIFAIFNKFMKIFVANKHQLRISCE